MTKVQTARRTICILAFLIIFHGCTTATLPKTDLSGVQEDGKRIASISETLVGMPYRFGGDTLRGFDCSGLVRYVYGQVGIEIPRSSRRLYQQSKKVPLESLQSGDLLFFKIDGKTVSHVAIYTQNRHFVHAPSSGKAVSTASLNSPYWSSRLVGAGRYW